MAFGPGVALVQGNPFSAALQVFQVLVGLFQGNQLRDLRRELSFLQSTFRGMRERGLFGSQTQRRMVEARTIWEEIGYAEPAEVPNIFRTVPPGTTLTVKGAWPPEQRSVTWLLDRFAGQRGTGATDIRTPDGSHWGFSFFPRSGVPIDALPGVGDEGVWAQSFPPEDLARALASQPKQYLGPRPLAGVEAARRRDAFRLGGGDVAAVWQLALEEQAEREGRLVRTWTGAGWFSVDPSRDIDLENPHSRAFHGGLLKANRIIGPPRSGQARVAELLGVTPSVTPRNVFLPAEVARVVDPNALTARDVNDLGNLGIRSLPQFMATAN